MSRTEQVGHKEQPVHDSARVAEAAADFIEGLLDCAELDGDLEFGVEENRPFVELPEGDCECLIGRDGDGIDALQLLTRLAVEQRRVYSDQRLVVDVAGFRAQQKAQIEAEAREAIDIVLSSGEARTMRPMNPFERWAVHDVVSESPGVVSESQGVAPTRYVIISPDDSK